MQVPVGKTLDVGLVEDVLAQLWRETTGAHQETDDAAVLRSRVANLVVFVSDEVALANSHQMLTELASLHPSRVLTLAGFWQGNDRDIEMTVESICQTDKRTGAKRLSCEEITLQAWGKFAVELPSAALPLLVPDLPTFLWWRGKPDAADKVFEKLLRATDRLVVDSVEFAEPARDVRLINEIFAGANYEHVGISDLNWARLTFWRGLIADFYDVVEYQEFLTQVDSVQIDYVAPEAKQNCVAPQALLIVGWLASRLRWSLLETQPTNSAGPNGTLVFTRGESPGREIKVALNCIERDERKPGRLVRVELRTSAAAAHSFAVKRSDDNRHILAEATLGEVTQRGRVLPVRDRSAAQLLGKEMEILGNDDIYQQAVAVAAQVLAILKD